MSNIIQVVYWDQNKTKNVFIDYLSILVVQKLDIDKKNKIWFPVNINLLIVELHELDVNLGNKEA